MKCEKLNFGEYSVKNVKEFQGMEGNGFNADLYRGKKKVAFCIDEGCGGEVMIHWADRDIGKRDEKEFVIVQKSVEKEVFYAYLKSLPQFANEFTESMLSVDATWFVGELVEEVALERERKKIAKKLSTKTMFTDGTKTWEVNSPYNEIFEAKIRAQYEAKGKKGTLTFLNTLPIEEAFRILNVA